MVDVDTFLTTLYVTVDEYDKAGQLPPAPATRGPAASLSRSEVITLALFGQWAQFASERAFYRYAERHLRPAFPRLPHRSQFNRLLRQVAPALAAVGLRLASALEAALGGTGGRWAFEVLDTTGVPTRNAQRRGRGWLAGQADLGYCARVGYYTGFHLLTAVAPVGVLTGLGFGPASSKDQPLADTFLTARAHPTPALASVGHFAAGYYLTDTGFEGRVRHETWADLAGAFVLSLPNRARALATQGWTAPARRLVASLREIIETAHFRLLTTFRLEHERPHTLAGFQARVFAKMAVYNFCLWLNHQMGRPLLALADLLDW